MNQGHGKRSKGSQCMCKMTQCPTKLGDVGDASTCRALLVRHSACSAVLPLGLLIWLIEYKHLNSQTFV